MAIRSGSDSTTVKNGDCHQFASHHGPRKKAPSLKRIGWLYPIFPLGKIARELFLFLCGVLLLLLPSRLPAQPTAEQIEFFESSIRPLFVEHCHQCHSQKANPVFGGLRLDSRSDLEKGSDSGPVVIPGKPEESRLVEVVRGTGALQMPPSGKLSADKIAALVKWIEMGAPWPDEKGSLRAKPDTKFDLEARRREHWAWHLFRRSHRREWKTMPGSGMRLMLSSWPNSKRKECSPRCRRPRKRFCGGCILT